MSAESTRASGDRAAAAERLLADHGVPSATVEAVGHGRDVAAVVAATESLDRLAVLAPRIKALGFKYIALDLRAEPRDRASPADAHARER